MAPEGPVALTVMSCDTPSSPRSVSMTVALNVALTVLGGTSGSVAVNVTVVVPRGKSEPERWSQVTLGELPSSSVELGITKPTAAPDGPVAWTVTSAGMLTSERSPSPTETRKVAVTLLGVSSGSEAVQMTLVMPIGNSDPDAGTHVTDGVGESSSNAVGGGSFTTVLDEVGAAAQRSDG